MSQQAPLSLDTGCHPVIPCLSSVCFDNAIHGRYASFYVNKVIRVKSSGSGRRMMLFEEPTVGTDFGCVSIK